MTDPKNDDQKTKIPYEPPRLFDLGGGVAYAAVQCKAGGSPAGGECASGTAATVAKCKVGNTAAKCQAGNIAA